MDEQVKITDAGHAARIRAARDELIAALNAGLDAGLWVHTPAQIAWDSTEVGVPSWLFAIQIMREL